ncbi:hypothetical protein AUP68_14794 [Ilyonectria robusta]
MSQPIENLSSTAEPDQQVVKYKRTIRRRITRDLKKFFKSPQPRASAYSPAESESQSTDWNSPDFHFKKLESMYAKVVALLGKRKWEPSQFNKDDADESSGGRENNPKGQSGDNDNHKRPPESFFACPFYKLNHRKFSECGTCKLRDLRCVKQHIKRKHLAGDDCKKCGTRWKDKKQWDDHIRAGDCQPRTPPLSPWVDGFLLEAELGVIKGWGPKGDEWQKWNWMYKKLFPWSKMPQSPYVRHGAVGVLETVSPRLERALQERFKAVECQCAGKDSGTMSKVAMDAFYTEVKRDGDEGGEPSESSESSESSDGSDTSDTSSLAIADRPMFPPAPQLPVMAPVGTEPAVYDAGEPSTVNGSLVPEQDQIPDFNNDDVSAIGDLTNHRPATAPLEAGYAQYDNSQSHFPGMTPGIAGTPPFLGYQPRNSSWGFEGYQNQTGDQSFGSGGPQGFQASESEYRPHQQQQLQQLQEAQQQQWEYFMRERQLLQQQLNCLQRERQLLQQQFPMLPTMGNGDMIIGTLDPSLFGAQNDAGPQT